MTDFKLLVGARRSRWNATRRCASGGMVRTTCSTMRRNQLLNRCSVFAGGFELESCLRSSGIRDGQLCSVMDLLDALVRKSLLVADRSSGRTRFSMLETIRQFAEDQLVARWFGRRRRTMPTPATSQAARPTSWPCGTARSSARPTRGSSPNSRICGPRFDGRQTAATWTRPSPSPYLRRSWAYGVEKYEPISWVEEILDDGVAANHPRLGFAYTLVAQSFLAGRIEEAVGYSDAGQTCESTRQVRRCPSVSMAGSGLRTCPSDRPTAGSNGRAQCERDRDTHGLTRAGLSIALMMADRSDEAMAVADGLIEVVSRTGNPLAMSYVLFAEGTAFRDDDPVRALNAFRRGLSIAARQRKPVERVDVRHGAHPDRVPTRGSGGGLRVRIVCAPSLSRIRQRSR